jgi:hypothetical protein
MPRLRPLLPALVIGLLTAACLGGTTEPTDSPTMSPTPTADATSSATPTQEPTQSPSEEPTQTPTESPSPSPTLVELPGGFTVHANAEADALFLDRDTCSNERDNYEVSFPDAWYTNTEIGRNPACIWFSPTDYDVPDPTVVPDEIAITIEWSASDFGRNDADMVTQEDVVVGGQSASRVEWDDDTYWYAIQLGPTPEQGPNLLVATSSEMGGDYELNKAVMDRMMATIEFFGSVD